MIDRVLTQLSDWLERHINARWWRRIDRFNRATTTLFIVLFALAGAAIAGWALTRGVWGVLFAVPVGVGAWLLLREWHS